MANDEHLKRLNAALEAKDITLWNRWRNENPMIQPELSRTILIGADLCRADFIGADFIGADLSRAQLIRADLSGAILIGVDLSKANLSKANLSGADLYGADLFEAQLEYADLQKAGLREAKLQFSTGLTQEQISGAEIDETTELPEHLLDYIDSSDLQKAGLREAKLQFSTEPPRKQVDRAEVDETPELSEELSDPLGSNSRNFSHEKTESKPQRPKANEKKVMWEEIDSRYCPNDKEETHGSMRRAKVPGGWFVERTLPELTLSGDACAAGIFFYPDPNHEWDGNSLP